MSVLHCILAFLTLPGSYLHAFWEHILLKLLRVPVEDDAYLQRNELCGHIEHKPILSLGKGLVFSYVPALLSAAIAFPMFWAGFLFLREWGVTLRSIETGGVSALFLLSVLLLYLGFSLVCNLFPTREDALFLCETQRGKNAAVRTAAVIPVWACRVFSLLSRFGVWHAAAAAAILCRILI